MKEEKSMYGVRKKKKATLTIKTHKKNKVTRETNNNKLLSFVQVFLYLNSLSNQQPNDLNFELTTHS